MALNPNRLSTNLLVTALVIVMVWFMPWLDRKICSRLEVSLSDGVSSNPNADRILHLRKILLYALFCLYLAMIAYVAFFSRAAEDEYVVHVNLYEDLASSIHIDFGILGLIHSIFTEGISEAMSHVRVSTTTHIKQVYMNICMFIPMGYLLPYISDKFRRHPRRSTLAACFFISLAVENLQLITRRGYYDVDDLFSNVIGGYIGVLLYMSVAYVLIHEDWKDELKAVHIWKRSSRKKALYRFAGRIHFPRTTVCGTERDPILDFYANVLGMRLASVIEDKDDGETNYLFQFGKNQLEVRCVKGEDVPPAQAVTIACNNSEYMRKRLIKNGVAVSEYRPDPYTGLRTFSIPGPDNVTVTVIEEY